MAVIIKRKAIIDDKEIIMRTFLPTGKISKNAAEKARILDKHLEIKMGQILQEMRNEGLLEAKALKKWHGLGKKLAFINNRSLVDIEDVTNGYIWLAIRQYCPIELLPKGTQKTELRATTGARREGKKYDHLDYCYQCGKYDWEDINWIVSWFDWITLIESPGLIRDPRIIPIMAKIVKSLRRSLTKKEFRAFAKSLRNFFSTKSEYRDTSGVDDAKIKEIITRSAREVSIIK